MRVQVHRTHAKGKAAWAKHVHKIATMLAFQHPDGYNDPNDISGAESLLENYFMLVCSAVLTVASVPDQFC